jgi:hypothetical protein
VRGDFVRMREERRVPRVLDHLHLRRTCGERGAVAHRTRIDEAIAPAARPSSGAIAASPAPPCVWQGVQVAASARACVEGGVTGAADAAIKSSAAAAPIDTRMDCDRMARA